MSSQTHPQKVHVAFFTTLSSIAPPRLLFASPRQLAVRTGRDDETSAQLPAAVAAADAARHVPPGGDLFPRPDFFGGFFENRRLAGRAGPGGRVRFVHFTSPVL